MRFYSWKIWEGVGDLIAEPRWLAWVSDASMAALAYSDAVVLCRYILGCCFAIHPGDLRFSSACSTDILAFKDGKIIHMSWPGILMLP